MIKILVLSLILVLTSCNKNNLPESIKEGLILDQKLLVEGNVREYHLYIPNEPFNAPVVMLLHGGGGSSDQVIGNTNIKSPQKLWLSIAEQNNLIVIIPNGSLGSSNRLGWNDCRNDYQGLPRFDDVAFISNLLDKVRTEYNYDDKKVYISGVSNGGFMAHRLAMEIPEKITAISAIIASIPGNTECANSTIPISMLFMNGTADSLVPYEGGQMSANRGLILSTDESIDYWKNRNGITENPIEVIIEDINSGDDCNAIKYHYKNGLNNTEIVLYKIINGGHTEPSIEERYGSIFLNIVGNQNNDIEMAPEIWNFFKGKSR